MRRWVLLAYRLPREPSTPRIALWRGLRRLGCAQIGDGLVALPLTAATREQLEWLAAAVDEGDGEASVWLGEAATREQERRWMSRMNEAIDAEYGAIEARAIGATIEDEPARRRVLRQLRAELQRIRSRDHFGAEGRAAAEAAVEAVATSGPVSVGAIQ